MQGEAKALEILKHLLSLTKADQAEAVLISKSQGLTRFANSAIHQNVYESDSVILLRVAIGKKIGVARTNMTDRESLKQLARVAEEIAHSQVANANFDGFAKSPRAPEVRAYFDETAECDPGRRAGNVKAAIREAEKAAFLAAGSHYTASNQMGYANTLGTTQYHRYTSAYMNMVVMSPTSSGYADFSCLNVAELDGRNLGEIATKICADSQEPRDLAEGTYDVVISSNAVSSLMGWLTWIGFSPEMFQDGRSFMTDRIGQRIMGSNISVWDDGLDPSGLPLPFDFEGVPRKRVDLIKQGIANSVVYSLISARREGKTSTGHALPPGKEISAMPINVFLAPGENDLNEMISSLQRGIVVTRFHYINGLLDTRKALFTGMTRDGTFYVEDGKIKYPIKNLRFTHSMLDAFSNVEMISRETKLHISDGLGAHLVPALKIKAFNFSGKTEF